MTTENYNFKGKRFLPYSDETSGMGGRPRPTTYGVYDNVKGHIHSLNSAETFEDAQRQAIELNNNPPKDQPQKKNKITSVLDTASEERNKETKTTFLKEWTPEQFKAIEKAISKHFSFKQLRTLHGNYPAYYMGFKALDQIMGFAYTSTSSYAGYWPCNTDVYNDKYPGYHYIGFAISTTGKCYGILWDKDENEIIIPL